MFSTEQIHNLVIIAKRIHLFPFRTQKLSSLALMVLGGQPPGRVRRSHVYGPLVKRSRHRPFTAVTGVRFPYGSPIPGTIAQLGEHLPYKQGVTGSSPVSPTICGLVVQLVRMPACHAGGRGFESLPGRQFNTLCWCGSTVEQLTCNQQVVGSIPITSSNKTLRLF